jgi:tryptophan-rich sensory protein
MCQCRAASLCLIVFVCAAVVIALLWSERKWKQQGRQVFLMCAFQNSCTMSFCAVMAETHCAEFAGWSMEVASYPVQRCTWHFGMISTVTY